jgi:alpha-mannosidase
MAKPVQQKAATSRQLEQWMEMARRGVKHKHRGVFSFEERMALKINELKNRMLIDVVPIDSWMIREFYFKDFGKYDYIDADWRPFPIGSSWGGLDVSAFLKQKVTVPEQMKGKKVILQIYLGGDSLLSINGEPFHGLDPFRNIITLTLRAKGDEVYNMLIEAYQTWHVREDKKNMLECSSLASVDTDIEEIYWDFMSVQATLAIPDIESSLKDFTTDIMEEAIAHVDPYAPDESEFKRKAKLGQKIIHDKFFSSQKFLLAGKVHLIGQSHIDLVFLWHYREFLRKIGRTHASTLRLMEEFPFFTFSQSQPLMYKEMKRLYPGMYQQIKQRVKEGRWDVIGGMWVEPDSNLPSGESFVRQLLFGSRFYQKEFGITPHTCWMPDCFGNCYTLPQILAKSGIEFFVTHKMSVWNDTNPWKLNQFWWEAPDGSRVFAVVPPTHFAGTADPDHIAAHWRKYVEHDKDNIGQSLYCYGWGDGGGGVDREMLNYIKRYVEHSGKVPGLPHVAPAKLEKALTEMRDKAKGMNLTVWKNELYLEAHRGVHTTKARLKKLNRYAEFLYREAELYSSIAGTMGTAYPQDRINAGWERLLTNQFHDSLPGSHIKDVYGDLLNEYQEAISVGEDVRAKALQTIAKNIAAPRMPGKPFAVFNALPTAASLLVSLDEKGVGDCTIADESGTPLPAQRITRLDGSRTVVFYASDVPAIGYKVFCLAKAKPVAVKSMMTMTKSKLENDFFVVKLNGEGEIVSLVDKRAGREVIKHNGKGNVFKIYEDIPSAYEAWDITLQYLDRELTPEKGEVSEGENGPVCAWVTVRKKFFNSVLRQKIIIYRDIPRIDFETEIDWVERKKLLKVGFDVDIMSTHYTSDIPFGTIDRPNYRFVDADKGKFEVCAHQWIDMSQEDYGVSILNDCKYGHEVTEQSMRLTLLKGPTFPDPDSDIELHHFTYSLYPHAGSWQQARTIQRALELNVPSHAVMLDETKGALPASYSFAEVSNPNITLEVLKKAEDSDDCILRVVDRCGQTAQTSVRLFAKIKKAVECDLMERELKTRDVAIKDDVLAFTIRPYEIKTFKMSF